MRLLLCGGSGFIGTALAKALLARGDEVWIVTRKRRHNGAVDLAVAGDSEPTKKFGSADRVGNSDAFPDSASIALAPLHGPRYVAWDELEKEAARFDGFDGVVNLAGESINQRWTAAAKRRIVDSRVEAAERVASVMRKMSAPPPIVVNASGISLYGHSRSDANAMPPEGHRADFDEYSSAQPADFLGDTVIAWEAAADRIPAERLVKLRIGLVIARQGGAFPLLRLPYRLFVGGRTGHGKQGLPWIHLQDMVGLILFSLDHPEVQGPLNAVAPDPVTNDAFGRALAAAMHRPHWFPVPGAMLKLLLGEMSTLVLTGQLAMPRKALDLGYKFAFPRLEDALRDLAR